jgi:beta-lactamase regulating signal transducer with metallopeptidase domain
MSPIPQIASLSRVAAGSLIASAWEASVLAVTVALYLRLIPRLSAAVRYTVWTAVLAVAVLLPLLGLRTHPAPAVSLPAHALAVDARWSVVLAGFWLALSIFRAAQLTIGAIRLRAIFRTAVPVPEAPLCCVSGTTRTAILCTSQTVARPSVLGFLSPRILIPAWLFAKLSPAEIDQIVLHEMQHLRRHDDWLNLLQKIGLILFPLNPALLWVERRLCLERELACDDAVLAQTNAPKAYATCLVHLAEKHAMRNRLSLALGAWERRSELARRIHAILRMRGDAMRQGPANAIAAALILAVTAGAATLSHAPALVSFNTSAPVSVAGEVEQQPAATGEFRAVTFHPSAVAFDPNDAPHATLLKAVMPEPTTAPVPAKPHRPARPAARHTSSPSAPEPLASTRRIAPPSSITLASEPAGVPANQPRLIFTVIDGPRSSHSYAAVPTPGGWLIFQL